MQFHYLLTFLPHKKAIYKLLKKRIKKAAQTDYEQNISFE